MDITGEQISANAVSVTIWKAKTYLTTLELQEVIKGLQEIVDERLEQLSAAAAYFETPTYDEYDEAKARETYEMDIADDMRDRENELSSECEYDIDDGQE